jgi:hypothetical protein
MRGRRACQRRTSEQRGVVTFVLLWRKSRATDHFNWQNGVPREHRFKTDRSERAACQKPTPMPSRGARSSPITSELPVIRSLLTLPTVQSFDAHAIDARNSPRPV